MWLAFWHTLLPYALKQCILENSYHNPNISPQSQVKVHYFVCEVSIGFVCVSHFTCVYTSNFVCCCISPVISVIKKNLQFFTLYLYLCYPENSASSFFSVTSALQPLTQPLNCIPGPSVLRRDCSKVLGDGSVKHLSGAQVHYHNCSKHFHAALNPAAELQEGCKATLYRGHVSSSQVDHNYSSIHYVDPVIDLPVTGLWFIGL